MSLLDEYREKYPARKKGLNADARQKEREKRNQVARQRVMQLLTRKYVDEYEMLYAEAIAEVDAERGPLPGDAS